MIVGALVCAPRAGAAQIVDLGSFTPSAVNSSDAVIGSDTASGVWQNGSVTHLQAPGTGGVGAVYDINDAGQIVGAISNHGPVNGYCDEATRWDLPAVDAPHPLGFLDPTGGQCHNGYSEGYGINRFGDVVGGSRIGQPGSNRAAIFRSGAAGPVQVGAADAPAGGGYSYGQGITDDGRVLGGWYSTASNSFHNLLWPDQTSPGTPINLAFHTEQGGNHLVSGDGVVVGSSGTTAYQRGLDGTQTAMGSFIPAAVNLSHDVVGNDFSATPDSEVPVEWKNGTLVHLSSLVPQGSGWQLISVADIADNGDIVGEGKLGGVLHGFLLKPPSLSVTLKAYDAEGNELSGSVSESQDIDVVETITNNAGSELHDLSFARGQVLGTEQGTGGVEILSGPDPSFNPSQTLAAGASVSYTFQVTATAAGRSALDTKVTALDPQNQAASDGHSLRLDISDGETVDKAAGNFLVVQSMDQLMRNSYVKFRDVLDSRAQKLHSLLADAMTKGQRQRWFGSLSGLPKSLYDQALASLRGSSPNLVAASLPKVSFKNYSPEDLQGAYNKEFSSKLGDGVSDYVKGWKDLGGKAKKSLEDSWHEAVLYGNYMVGTATPEQRTEFEAYSMALVDGLSSTPSNFVSKVSKEAGQWKENGLYLAQAAKMAGQDALLQTPDLQAALRQEKIREANWIKNAPDDPIAFEKAMASRDAEIANAAIPTIFDTLIGGGVLRAGGAAKGAIVRGAGAGILRAGEAGGVLDEAGAVVKGPTTAVPPPNPALPAAPSMADEATIEGSGGFLGNTEHATVIESSDTGTAAYEVPNVGGVPETTIDAKAKILGKLQSAFRETFDKDIKLVEIAKPGSPLEKAGGTAKTELTEQKTAKSAMLDAGLPTEALGEADVWTSPENPKDLPGFEDLSKARQQAAINEWEKANAAWDDFENPAPGSKTARLKQCIGQRCTVPLDTSPNAEGIQRFVTAEYEVKQVEQGAAKAKLIRVKYYEVDVKDVNTGQTLNSKVVVDSPTALPQTPDADAVALGKVVGTNADGTPKIAPLDRAEREFIYQRYIDENIKARRSGAVPGLSEHGATLIMDDAGALAAGKLIPRYGAIFLPEEVGFAYLKRIAPFVKPAGVTTDQMFQKMLDIVRSEGGFGQKAVVITSDSRYFGEVPFANW